MVAPVFDSDDFQLQLSDHPKIAICVGWVDKKLFCRDAYKEFDIELDADSITYGRAVVEDGTFRILKNPLHTYNFEKTPSKVTYGRY